MSLSERIRSNIEAAPWVIDEVRKLESELSATQQKLEAAEAECLEQARLNGMGSEREARLIAENVELTRKLAEQQSLLVKLAEWFGKGSIYGESQDAAIGGTEELTKLLAEAKSKAVPEGWQIVPKNPTAKMYLEGENLMDATPRTIYKAMLSAAPQQETDIVKAGERLETIETSRKIDLEEL